ncbi:MAG: gliding motility-associated protein GldE [Bacteroidota bacterium]|nr:MAG: gliding motility-associated protein GldE [Bacteroidota bacterium]
MDEPPSYALYLLASSGTGLIYILGITALLLLGLSALITASETALLQDEGSKRNGSSTNLKDATLLPATIRIVRHALVIAVVTLCAGILWTPYGEAHARSITILVIVIVTTFALVAFGDLTPRAVAARYRTRLIRIMLPFWKFALSACKPLAVALSGMDRAAEQRLQEQVMPARAQSSNGINGEEPDFLKGIEGFGTLTVRQVMRSRIDIAAVDVAMNFHELMDYINKTGFSRMPAYRDTIDHIEGILYIKDLLPFTEEDENFRWQNLLRPGFFVPENKKIDSLLKDFQEKRVHIAMVVDEYGGTVGLITLEDIIEEIIGEINDEFDEEATGFRQIDEHTYVFEGKTLLHDLCKTLEVDGSIFDEVRGESESLAGLILELTNDLPNVGKKITFKQFTFTIEAVDKRRIKRVRVHINEHEES